MYKEVKKAHKKITSLFLIVVMVLSTNIFQAKADNENPDGCLQSITDNLGEVQNSWYIEPDSTLYTNLTTGNTYASSYTTAEAALEISNAAELAAFAKAVNEGGKDFKNKFVKLTADINLNGSGITFTNSAATDGKFTVTIATDGTPSNLWKPVGTISDNTFEGTFDGNHHKIYNMITLSKSHADAGLFGSAMNATIKNVIVEGSAYANFDNDAYSGGLIGWCDTCQIENCLVNVNTYAVSSSGDTHSGGLIGESDTGSINYSSSLGNSYAFSSKKSSAGGLIGACDYYINYCYAVGYAYATSLGNESSDIALSGGLAASTEGNVSGCYATGNCYSLSDFRSYSGSLVAKLGSNSLDSCFATGNATAMCTVNQSSKAYVGKLHATSGRVNSDCIRNCYYNSSATATGICPDANNVTEVTAGIATALSNLKGQNIKTTVTDFAPEQNDPWKFIDGDFPVLIPLLKTLALQPPESISVDYSTGLKLSDVTISDNVSSAYGAWEWDEPDTNLAVGTNSYQATFTPDNVHLYNSSTRSIPVTVNNVDLTLQPENISVAYAPGLKLSDLTISDSVGSAYGTWEWDEPDTNLAVGTNSYQATFTPNDESLYSSVSRSISVTVAKATPTCIPPTKLCTLSGQTLSTLTLTNSNGNTDGAWVWDDSSTVVSGYGFRKYPASFTPTDTTNYNVVENIDVDVAVINTPAEVTALLGQTLNEVAIKNPAGNITGTWTWNNASTPVGAIGSKTFAASFNPTNTSYSSISNVQLNVKVVNMSSGISPIRESRNNSLKMNLSAAITKNDSTSYQWQRSKDKNASAELWENCIGTGKNTDTYVLEDSDYNYFVRLKVAYTPEGSSEQTTLYSNPVKMMFKWGSLSWS